MIVKINSGKVLDRNIGFINVIPRCYNLLKKICIESERRSLLIPATSFFKISIKAFVKLFYFSVNTKDIIISH